MQIWFLYSYFCDLLLYFSNIQDVSQIRTSADEMEMYGHVSRKFRQYFTRQEHFNTFRTYDKLEVTCVTLCQFTAVLLEIQQHCSCPSCCIADRPRELGSRFLHAFSEAAVKLAGICQVEARKRSTVWETHEWAAQDEESGWTLTSDVKVLFCLQCWCQFFILIFCLDWGKEPFTEFIVHASVCRKSKMPSGTMLSWSGILQLYNLLLPQPNERRVLSFGRRSTSTQNSMLSESCIFCMLFLSRCKPALEELIFFCFLWLHVNSYSVSEFFPPNACLMLR